MADPMVKEISLGEQISYIPASETPLSADVVIIRRGTHALIFDVGASEEVVDYLNALCVDKYVALSHFHADHIANLPRMICKEVYGGKETIRHTHVGVLISDVAPMPEFSVTLLPLPSSHAKGSLAMIAGDILFTGDGLYGKVGEGYNLQILYRTLAVLEGLPKEVTKIALSHTERFLFDRDEVVSRLKEAYKKKDTQMRLFLE